MIHIIKAKRDIINSIVILVFCAFAYYESLSISSPAMGKTGAAFYPRLVIAFIVFLSLLYLITSIVRLRKETDSKLDWAILKWTKDNKRVLLTFMIFGVYILLMSYIGYIVATFLFLFGMYILLNPKKEKFWMVGLGIVILTLVLFFIFQDLLSVFLPGGRWF